MENIQNNITLNAFIDLEQVCEILAKQIKVELVSQSALSSAWGGVTAEDISPVFSENSTLLGFNVEKVIQP